MRSVVVVETFPGSQLFLEIDVVAISEKLIELLFVGSMGSFDLAVELRSAWLDVDVLHAEVGDVPVEECLEFVATVGLDGANPEGELVDHVVDEVDGAGLGVAAINLKRADSRGIIDRRVLISPDRSASFPL